MSKDILDFIRWLFKNEMIIDDKNDDYINSLFGEYMLTKNK